MIRWVPTVRFVGLSTQMLLAAMRIDDICKTMGVDCWITSANDLTHMKGSLHYEGRALDSRTRDIPSALLSSFEAKVKAALGNEFDVVRERDHLHVEYQPKAA